MIRSAAAGILTSRAASRFKEGVPRLIDDPESEGGQCWVSGDIRLSPPGLCVIRPDRSKALGIFTLSHMDQMTPASTQVDAVA